MNLIFIYNANSGFANAAIDSLHKVFSPKTYQCSLCNLTHGLINEKQEWSEFIKQSEHTLEFLHKDNIRVKKIEKVFRTDYPCVLLVDNKNVDIIISSEKLNNVSDLEELIDLVKNI